MEGINNECRLDIAGWVDEEAARINNE